MVLIRWEGWTALAKGDEGRIALNSDGWRFLSAWLRPNPHHHGPSVAEFVDTTDLRTIGPAVSERFARARNRQRPYASSYVPRLPLGADVVSANGSARSSVRRLKQSLHPVGAGVVGKHPQERTGSLAHRSPASGSNETALNSN